MSPAVASRVWNRERAYRPRLLLQSRSREIWVRQLVMCTVPWSPSFLAVPYNCMDPGWGARISYGGSGPYAPLPPRWRRRTQSYHHVTYSTYLSPVLRFTKNSLVKLLFGLCVDSDWRYEVTRAPSSTAVHLRHREHVLDPSTWSSCTTTRIAAGVLASCCVTMATAAAHRAAVRQGFYYSRTRDGRSRRPPRTGLSRQSGGVGLDARSSR